MVKSVWIAIVLFLLSSICCLAQSNDEDAGGFVAGEYGAGGRTGSGGVYLGLYDTGGLQRLASPFSCAWLLSGTWVGRGYTEDAG